MHFFLKHLTDQPDYIFITALNTQQQDYLSNLNILRAWTTFVSEGRGLASFSCILYSLWLILTEDGGAAQEDWAERLPAAVRGVQRYAKARGRV